MRCPHPTRRNLPDTPKLTPGARLCASVFAALLAGCSLSGHAQQQHPAPIYRQPPSAQQPHATPRGELGNPSSNNAAPRNQEHLSEWMSRHRNLPVPQQERALESEPGFRELPEQTQQRMRDHLAQLNNMRPEQRNRILERNEEMEHLSIPQRQQVRGAMLQLGSLPEGRRRAVARAFRDLRTMPEYQRQQYLNSPAFHSQFSDQERGTLGNLMSVEPYLPNRPASMAPRQ